MKSQRPSRSDSRVKPKPPRELVSTLHDVSKARPDATAEAPDRSDGLSTDDEGHRREHAAVETKAKSQHPARAFGLGANKEGGPDHPAIDAAVTVRGPGTDPKASMEPEPEPVAPTKSSKPTAAKAETVRAAAAPIAPATVPGAEDAERVTTPGMSEFERLSRNMGLLLEESQKVAAAYMEPRSRKASAPLGGGEDVKDMAKTLGQVAGYWFMDPTRMVVAQATLSSQILDLWADTMRRMTDGAVPEPSSAAVTSDKRFAAPEWREFPAFDFIRQAYLRTTDWANTLVEDAELDEETRDKARFYLRQLSGALSPSNYLATNPELLKHTFAEGGENLVRGMRMLAEDVAAGGGDLKIRQSDTTAHKLGVNMAVTPGKVVFRNDLMELIQYAPSTPDVYRRPLLIVPPWINKFYVLDLNPAKSLVKWIVDQGLTVFVISWVNPDERHADKDFESYMREGIFAALDAMEGATGERDAAAVGYCVGGTLLAVTLAYMAAKGDTRISSATFFTAQTDFRDAGDLKIFADEEQISAVEAEMKQQGYLSGSKMANAFNMLRPNDLIWSYVVNNYIKGKAPPPFDLLTWNSDSTRMPAANHAFYLRNCYLGNKLTKGEMVLGGETLDLGRVTIPVYNLATREDHIAPARSVYVGARYFGGPMRYVLAGSGHIAGVINPPYKPKYQFWSGPPVEGTYEDWLAAATETAGSWWPDWISWVAAQKPAKVLPREPGAGKLPALCDAPGDYVRVQG
jgi:polyhydroxyalkanoate synthase